MKKSIVLTLAFVMSMFTVSFAQDGMAKTDEMTKKHTMVDKETMTKKDAMMKEETMTKKDGMMKKEMSAPKTVKLEQTVGEFNIQGLTLSEGTYIFEISNNGVDHEVGFVIAPKGKTDQANHIKEGYVTETIKDGKTSSTQVVTLAKGEYVYFCPLNPTPQYSITVK